MARDFNIFFIYGPQVFKDIVYNVKGFVHLLENHYNKLQKQIKIDKNILQISLKKNVMYHFKKPLWPCGKQMVL